MGNYSWHPSKIQKRVNSAQIGENPKLTSSCLSQRILDIGTGTGKYRYPHVDIKSHANGYLRDMGHVSGIFA